MIRYDKPSRAMLEMTCMFTSLSPQCPHSNRPTHHLLHQSGCTLVSTLRAGTLSWTPLFYFGSLLVNPCLHSQVLWTPRLSYCPGPQHHPPPLTFISEHDQDQKLNKPHVVRHSYGFELMSHGDQGDQQGASQR